MSSPPYREECEYLKHAMGWQERTKKGMNKIMIRIGQVVIDDRESAHLPDDEKADTASYGPMWSAAAGGRGSTQR